MGKFRGRPSRLDEILTPEQAQELIEKTVEQIDELENDYPEVWERAEDKGFELDDIRDRLRSMGKSIEKYENVTGPMSGAIRNMCDGVAGWYAGRDNQYERDF